jgi:hypothetical protein
VPTPQEMIKLSGSFAARARLLRRLGNAKQAELYDLASRVAMEKARRLARETRRPAVSFAEELRESAHVSLLNETLEEEKETDEALSDLGGDINAQANQGEDASGEASEEGEAAAAKKKSRNAA